MTETIPRSEELFAPVSPGVELCYQTFGDPNDPALLLVMGLGGPMTWWDADFCELLAGRGFFVVRFDNRDAGRSSKLIGRVSRLMLLGAAAGLPTKAPYTMSNLADDAFGLLDHLGVERAHIVGMSMGGMIVQTMALAHPERVRSLTSIMSSTGKRTVGWQHPSILPRLIGRRETEREAYVSTSVAYGRVIGSPAYPEPEESARARAEATWDRGLNPAGVMRQMIAILTQPDRTESLSDLAMPTQVIHGLSDKMVHVSGGRTTSSAVPGSNLLLIDGMGHDLPRPLWPTFADAIASNAARAR
ncbi:alpha/beta fold hydrolase [Nocardioides sp. Bht2]|uniref:alpha/beta fold hydrolase n=1 Tax=Nocardioides sp. Bht2 TaxID=3392297 RepID=UPI0039B3AD7C